MSKIHLVFFLIVGLLISCNSQTQNIQKEENALPNIQWKEYKFDDAGIKTAFPCEPKKEILIAEEKPKSTRKFDFKCDKNQVTFFIELNEHLSTQDKRQVLDVIESMLQEKVGQKNNIEIKNSVYQDRFPMRTFNITNPTTYWRETSIVNDRGVYNISVFFRKEGQMTSDFYSEFENTYSKFFDSFKILEQ